MIDLIFFPIDAVLAKDGDLPHTAGPGGQFLCLVWHCLRELGNVQPWNITTFHIVTTRGCQQNVRIPCKLHGKPEPCLQFAVCQIQIKLLLMPHTCGTEDKPPHPARDCPWRELLCGATWVIDLMVLPAPAYH